MTTHWSWLGRYHLAGIHLDCYNYNILHFYIYFDIATYSLNDITFMATGVFRQHYIMNEHLILIMWAWNIQTLFGHLCQFSFFSKWVCLADTLAQVLWKVVVEVSTHMILHVWCTVVWFSGQGIPRISFNSLQMCSSRKTFIVYFLSFMFWHFWYKLVHKLKHARKLKFLNISTCFLHTGGRRLTITPWGLYSHLTILL